MHFKKKMNGQGRDSQSQMEGKMHLDFKMKFYVK